MHFGHRCEIHFARIRIAEDRCEQATFKNLTVIDPQPMFILAPGDEDELADMMFTATHQNQPAFIRYPRGNGEGVAVKEQPALIEIGKAEVLQNFSNNDKPRVAFFALGPMRAIADAAI